MAEAMTKGLIAGGIPASGIAVAEPVAERRSFLGEHYGVSCTDDNASLVKESDVIILAVKPQVAGKVLHGIGTLSVSGKLFISIMAGVKSSTIEAAFKGEARVVRVMPNTPALVLEASSAIAPGAFAKPEDTAITRSILEMVGKAWIIEEKLMDAVTGLSGSGPAYVLAFIEALSDAGVKNGLSREIATGLAAQTVFGTAKLLLETGEHPAVLRDKVTSPGGTTIAGLHVLEKEGFSGAVIDAVDAATSRSKELGQK
jgi:pyrroline-5-carboxylate reductase